MRVIVAGEHRQKIVTDAVAREASIVVGGVVPGRLAQFAQILQHLLARNGQQRANHLHAGPHRAAKGDAAQPVQPRAAEQAMKHRLGLVAGRVAGGDVMQAVAARRLRQPAIAFAAGHGFEVAALFGGQSSDIETMQGKCKMRLSRSQEAGVQIDDERFIGVTVCAAQLVIEMGQDERDRPGGADGEQGAQQGNAVGTAAEGDDEARRRVAQGKPGPAHGGQEHVND